MRILLLIALLACAGCLENESVCEIEYMDGTKESIECFDATVKEPFFGSPTVLKIYVSGGDWQIKSLATIKRWKLRKK